MLHIFDWLIFHYFLQLFFRLTPLSSSAKSNEKLVNQKYAALFLFWMPSIFWQFSLLPKFTMGSFKHFVFKFWQLMYYQGDQSWKDIWWNSKVISKEKFSPIDCFFFLFLIFGKRSYISSPTNLTSLLFQHVILNKNSENQIYLAKGS